MDLIIAMLLLSMMSGMILRIMAMKKISKAIGKEEMEGGDALKDEERKIKALKDFSSSIAKAALTTLFMIGLCLVAIPLAVFPGFLADIPGARDISKIFMIIVILAHCLGVFIMLFDKCRSRAKSYGVLGMSERKDTRIILVGCLVLIGGVLLFWLNHHWMIDCLYFVLSALLIARLCLMAIRR